ncbi:hypothetical protein ACOME3_000456 [Neoechinorhynchus agilis]
MEKYTHSKSMFELYKHFNTILSIYCIGKAMPRSRCSEGTSVPKTRRSSGSSRSSVYCSNIDSLMSEVAAVIRKHRLISKSLSKVEMGTEGTSIFWVQDQKRCHGGTNQLLCEQSVLCDVFNLIQSIFKFRRKSVEMNTLRTNTNKSMTTDTDFLNDDIFKRRICKSLETIRRKLSTYRLVGLVYGGILGVLVNALFPSGKLTMINTEGRPLSWKQFEEYLAERIVHQIHIGFNKHSISQRRQHQKHMNRRLYKRSDSKTSTSEGFDRSGWTNTDHSNCNLMVRRALANNFLFLIGTNLVPYQSTHRHIDSSECDLKTISPKSNKFSGSNDDKNQVSTLIQQLEKLTLIRSRRICDSSSSLRSKKDVASSMSSPLSKSALTLSNQLFSSTECDSWSFQPAAAANQLGDCACQWTSQSEQYSKVY